MNLLDSNVLFVPSLRKGNGTGHLRRILYALTLFNGSKTIYVPKLTESFDLEDFVSRRQFADLRFRTIDRLPENCIYDVCIVDNRNTTLSEVAKIRKAGRILISVDEGGPGRSASDYLIDALYFPGRKRKGNIQVSPLLYSSSEVGKKIEKSVLVTFGGEDAAGLTEKTLRILKNKVFSDLQITVVKGPLCKRDFQISSSVHILSAPDTLQDILQKTETVITSYGLTAFESRQAGCRTGIVHPTRYHQRISRRAGFQSLGYKQPSAKKLIGLLQAKIHSADNERLSILGELLEKLSVPEEGNGCPACGGKKTDIRERLEDRTVYVCRDCKILHVVFWTRKESRYQKSYFFEEYRQQYGKDYLEDFGHIKEMGFRRLRHIDAVRGNRNKGSILDIGCAFGPFLQASAEMGWKPLGLDISNDAVKYICDTLKIDALTGNFEIMDIPEHWNLSFDCISLWYVIEHFKSLSTVLQRIQTILSKGGILAFSTPHYGGISSLKDRRSFFAQSPDDHFTIWSRKSVRRLLKRYGFKIKKIVVTGHHPERFCNGSLPDFFGRFLNLISRIFGLGDTFEIYAEKTRVINE